MSFSMLLRRSALTVVALACVALPAAAITDLKFTYSTEQTGFLTISPMAMAPDGDATAAKPWLSYWGGARLTGRGCFQTGVNLPQGARIAEVRTWFQKAITFEMWSAKLADGVATKIVGKDTTAADPTARRNFGLAPATATFVDNRAQTYGFGVCLEENEIFFGARIIYKYTSAGD
ncbi:hypothetical protein [Oharaeibacter diazotrophicus]|uniref:Uncharacterized protein n=1 Tax=Oharaeibacter diazotrophicus TaxID=1920512 RepID=A0A4R6RJX8_9HYPH|nr:hypothetical protein [Oharaeibacter diazotrophicus]TDP86754.1 hypothetical protein EDD54_0635 [Oharaeibacter diazotrophicus]BBE71303.1 hypothetical protein OHA_1_00876 [Pleomorphomonas sp. SM30]GLS78058.1 hypothetical protein GCM10007904_33950 [Oharaeibacter diazotrophicus]